MPEFQAKEAQHQEWKRAVMAGEERLEDIDVNPHKRIAVMDVMAPNKNARPSQEQIQEIARRKAAEEAQR